MLVQKRAYRSRRRCDTVIGAGGASIGRSHSKKENGQRAIPSTMTGGCFDFIDQKPIPTRYSHWTRLSGFLPLSLYFSCNEFPLSFFPFDFQSSLKKKERKKFDTWWSINF